jgi:glucose/arabinose dehydrogenase
LIRTLPGRPELLGLGLFLLLLAPALAQDKPAATGPVMADTRMPLEPMVTGLRTPESVAIGPDGRIYVTEIGAPGKDGDGAVVVIQGGKAVPFATGLNDPKGLVAWRDWLFVADKDRIWRIDRKGKVSLVAGPNAFPTPPRFLNDIEADEGGNLYVSDSGDLKGKEGAVFKVTQKGTVSVIVNQTKHPFIRLPNGLRMEGETHLHYLDFGTGELYLLRLADGKMTKLAEGFGGADGITRDRYGRLFISDWKNGKVFVIPRPAVKPILLAEGFGNSADICLSADGRSILVPDMKGGTLTAVPIRVPGEPIDEKPLPVKVAVAFPDLHWTGWSDKLETGKVVPHRPLVLTHAGDGSGRVFVGTQQGVIHVFPNDQKAKQTKIFLDIQERVSYSDSQNEEGFLGFCFPLDYKKTGEFYVYYTTKQRAAKEFVPLRQLTNVVSRFRVSKDDPDRADPKSEEVLMRFEKPFWNHDGGTICFGPDGYLYIAIGDGGAANDPFNHGQSLNTHLGKILRIDVSKKGAEQPYAIPADNPFVGKEKARPEIWAYGLRNVWRMSFDNKTGRLWAADVGQNLWEEIDLIEKGGNYGWNLREGFHAFGARGSGPRPDLIEPIWEYHHDIGKSITGGHVYRGSRIPELQGLYLYADYVSGVVWGLRYDEKLKRVVANHTLRPNGFPVFSFGEDDKGEVYILTSTTTGQGIHWFVPAGEKKTKSSRR